MSNGIAFTYPDPSHVNSVLPVFAELARRGEQLIVYSSDLYREPIQQAGLRHRSYGESMPASGGGPFAGMVRRLGFAESIVPGLIAQLRDERPDYVIADAAAIWGGIVGHALHLPSIGYRATFVVREGMISTEELARMFYAEAPREFVFGGMVDLIRYYETARRLDREYGTHTADVIAGLENRQALNLVLISRELQIQGETFDDAYKFVGRCLGGVSDPGDFPFEKLEARPLIYVSLGTIFNDSPEFFRACFEAFRDIGYQVVMSIGHHVDEAALGRPPDNFVVAHHVPQIEILKRAALFISHAGPNSVEESLRQNVPMLVWPQAGDQFGIAEQVVGLGVGVRLNPADMTPASLKDAALKVLSEPGFKVRATNIGRAMCASGGGTAVAVSLIEKFVSLK